MDLKKLTNKLKHIEEFAELGILTEGYYEMPSMDKERYTDLSQEGLEGPFMTRSGKVIYYDPKEGKYYDRDSDMYLSYEEFQAYDKSKPDDYKITKMELPTEAAPLGQPSKGQNFDPAIIKKMLGQKDKEKEQDSVGKKIRLRREDEEDTDDSGMTQAQKDRFDVLYQALKDGPEHNEIKRKIRSPIATDGDYHSMVKRKAMESKKATDSFLTDYKSIMVRTK
jgi:hypothetical protein